MSLEFPVYTRNGLTIVGGKGYRVTDSNGREYLDFYGGHAVAILGHANPEVTQAITEQASNLTFQTNVVDVLVHRLRTKIDKDFPVKLIQTLRGIGYVLKSA